ncbi:hypothetical protein OS493_012562 [Desmophyllum pertusum]|uniref:Xanthine dehydrogenase n=1 Tax=Desmophyllum pertusum TaxID=174260 RepID=A0A9X0CY38_9CNID|nr:hypothetical protein OS493_012562 [Desmophyllum pertusum]
MKDSIIVYICKLPDTAKPSRLYIKGDHVTWIRPTTLDELLELKMKYPQAKLVIGNTEIGIEMKFKNQNYPILIAPTHIPELNAVETHSRRHQAIGGNIMTASPISDLNPVFMAARIQKNDLGASEVLINILIPFTKKHEHVFAFKQARRREDDIAIVNTAMRVLLEKETNSSSWKIMDCSFSFGGLAPTTVMAKRNESIVQEACQLLAEDLPLAPGAPGGQVEYRRSLATSFFFKFYLNVSQSLSKNEFLEITTKGYESGTKHFHRDATHSIQTFQEVPNDQTVEDVVGRPVAHLAAEKHATGEAIYCDDIPKYAGELYLGIVFSTRAHANIIAVDPSEALCLPGVKAYVSADDVPGENSTGSEVYDEEVYATDTVTCVGQEAIAAGSFYECEPCIHEKGDLETGFAESDHVLEGEMRMEDRRRLWCKQTRNCFLTNAVAVAAAKTGMPVRCMLDRDEDMKSTGMRSPFLAKYKVMGRALFHMENCYLIPNIRGVGYLCKTNIPSTTGFRGFGVPQSICFAESWISDIALTCGISQRQVREVNFYKEGDLTHFNQKLTNCYLQRVWNELIEKCDYEKRRELVHAFNRENRWRKRGIALTPAMLGLGFGVPALDQAGALVHVYTDGSVILTHGGTEMGQGLHTKMVQVAARSLGIPVSKILISETSTNTVPNTSPTAASASTDLNGMAVKIACEQILERLKPYQMANPKGKWEDWVHSAYFDRVNLSANGFYKRSNKPLAGFLISVTTGRPIQQGGCIITFTYGAACSEVEIDCLTGDHQVLRTDIVMDVGTSLNPAIDIGQIEGGFVQGLGLYTLEEMRCSQTGSLWTTGPGAYKIPGFADIPVEFNVHLLRSAPNEKTIYSSKGVGEPPVLLSVSVLFAIKDAITYARRESGIEGIFRLDSPATSERIRMACVDKFTEQFTSVADPSVKDFNVYP